MNRIYLDYNATAPIRPGVQEAVAQALSFGNPSAVHAEGRRARAAVEQARAQVAEFCGAAPEGVVFTSGGTEACNLALGLRAAHTETKVTSEDRTTRRVCSMHPTSRPASEIELSVDREAAAPPPRSRRRSRPCAQPH